MVFCNVFMTLCVYFDSILLCFHRILMVFWYHVCGILTAFCKCVYVIVVVVVFMCSGSVLAVF